MPPPTLQQRCAAVRRVLIGLRLSDESQSGIRSGGLDTAPPSQLQARSGRTSAETGRARSEIASAAAKNGPGKASRTIAQLYWRRPFDSLLVLLTLHEMWLMTRHCAYAVGCNSLRRAAANVLTSSWTRPFGPTRPPRTGSADGATMRGPDCRSRCRCSGSRTRCAFDAGSRYGRRPGHSQQCGHDPSSIRPTVPSSARRSEFLRTCPWCAHHG